MQSSYLTGKGPSGHGIVGNGWYFRDLGEIHFWKQSNRLVQGEKLWHEAQRRNPAFTCANSFWWYNMATDVTWSITPRPIYRADGRKHPDCYTQPPHLRSQFTESLGHFPLFRFWGPTTSIESSRWIAQAAMYLEEHYRPSLHLIYLPHLDYILQKVGPQGEFAHDLQQIDDLCGLLLDFFRQRGCRVLLLSEYGISQVHEALFPNRVLREAGMLKVKEDFGREYLDVMASDAFAVSDHQVAHVYLRDRKLLPAVKRIMESMEGIGIVLDHEGKGAHGIDHPRAGDLVVVAAKGRWFSYYYWWDDRRAPDFARTVNIHAKPGYDPCELFFDPAIRFPHLSVAWHMLKQACGFRSLLSVIPLDASLVKGSHGRIPENDDVWPVVLSSEPALLPSGPVPASAIYHLILEHLFTR